MRLGTKGNQMRRLGAAVGVAIAVGALSADAGERQWYASIEGGAEFSTGDVGSIIVASPLCGGLGLGPCEPDTSLETGWAAFGTVGTHIAPNVRLEGELGYRSQSLGGRSDLSQTTLMVNALFDVPVSDQLTLSLGGGLGYDWVDTGSGNRGLLPGDDAAFAYQLIAGLSYDISESVALTLNYRYTNAEFDDLHAEVDDVGGRPGAWAIAVNDWDTVGTVSVGLRFGF